MKLDFVTRLLDFDLSQVENYCISTSPLDLQDTA